MKIGKKHAAVVFSSPVVGTTKRIGNDLEVMHGLLEDGGESVALMDHLDLPMGTVMALAAWAKRTLESMERTPEWSADITDAMAKEAQDMGLAVLDDDGMFRVAL